MTVVAVLLVMVAIWWLGSAQKRARGSVTAREPDGLAVLTPQSIPLTARRSTVRDTPEPVSPRATATMRAEPVTRVPNFRAPDPRATAWMLSKRGLCSPDPHP